MNKRVGRWLFEYALGSCTIVRTHDNGSDEEVARIWHQNKDDLTDLQYGIGRVLKQMDEQYEHDMQDRLAYKMGGA